jgi:hypothetical protein
MSLPLIRGSRSNEGSLIGTVHVIRNYSGDYEVTPDAWEPTVLDTENRLMARDIVVNEVPHYEVSNESDGTTFYIG